MNKTPVRILCFFITLSILIFAIIKCDCKDSNAFGILLSFSLLGTIPVTFGFSEIIFDLKKFFFFLIIICIFSCQNEKIPISQASLNKGVVLEKDTNFFYFKMNDPALFLGTDFISAFQAYYRIGDYNSMMKFTHSETLKKHGYDNVKQFYKKMNFGYKIHLMSKNKENDTFLLNYETYSFATRRMKRFMVKIENDSCKILLPDTLSRF